MAAVIRNEAAWREPVDESRFNIYSIIHKGLRGFMTDTVLKLGRMDVTDDCERAHAIEQLRALLAMCLSHLRHENEFVHPTLEKVAANATRQTADDHVAHQEEIGAFETQIAQFEAAPAARWPVLAYRLYLDVSAFLAENFAHMIVEETQNHALLISACTEEQVMQIEHSIVASLSAEELGQGLRWMLGHINASERAFMLAGMKRNTPAPVFDGVLALARDVLSQRDYYKLEKAIA